MLCTYGTNTTDYLLFVHFNFDCVKFIQYTCKSMNQCHCLCIYAIHMYILETCFRFYQSENNQKSKNNKNKNKKFNTMANDIPRTVLKKNEQQQRFASFVVSDSCCLLLLGLSMKLNHATWILTALITDSMWLCTHCVCTSVQ